MKRHFIGFCSILFIQTLSTYTKVSVYVHFVLSKVSIQKPMVQFKNERLLSDYSGWVNLIRILNFPTFFHCFSAESVLEYYLPFLVCLFVCLRSRNNRLRKLSDTGCR